MSPNERLDNRNISTPDYDELRPEMSVYLHPGRTSKPSNGKKIPRSIQRESEKLCGTRHKKSPTELNTPAPRIGQNTSDAPSLPTSANPWIKSYPLPDWYRTVTGGMNTKMRTEDSASFEFLMDIRSAVLKCEKTRRLCNNILNDQQYESALETVRSALHKAERGSVTDRTLKRSRILEPDPSVNGLVTIFGDRGDNKIYVYPYDIRADALAVYRKWIKLDCNPDIFRGLVFQFATNARKRKGMTLDKNYSHRVSGAFSGEGDLVNGQWWPNRFAMLRDGAHAATVAGIHGKAGEGAYSVVVAGGYPEDRDSGDQILYCGTPGRPQKSTKDTLLLVDNMYTRIPVRVIRTAGLPQDNAYRPIVGCRYDGLYTVNGRAIMDASLEHYRFRLVRMPNQDPIRYQGPEARPTAQEISEYLKHQQAIEHGTQ